MDKNTFYQYNDNRALSGYKAAWLYKPVGADKYSLVGLTESVPYVFGDKETFEYDILQSPTKGQVEGKQSLEAVDVEVLAHRDNAYRFEKLKGQTLNFMVVNSEFMAYTYVGTVDYRPNTAEADVHKATVTITPISANATPVFNARDMIMETLCFKEAIAESVALNAEVDFAVKQADATVTLTVKSIAGETNAESDATSMVTVTGTKVKFTTKGLYAITVAATGYAPWTTTVYAGD